MSDFMQAWVIIRSSDGTVRIWRDFGVAWSSPSYTVLGYFVGRYRDARIHARSLADNAPEA